MTRREQHLDDRTYATRPGGVGLSTARLGLLEPKLLQPGRSPCGPRCAALHTHAELRDRLDDALRRGDSSVALVVALDPLVVAVSSDDLDAAVLLGWADAFAAGRQV